MQMIGNGRPLRFVNAALLVLAAAVLLAGATSAQQEVAQEIPTIEAATLWMDTVQLGEFTQSVRGAGSIIETDDGALLAQLRIPETQSWELEVGQPATIDLKVAEVAGRVSNLDRVIEQGTLTVTVEFTEDLPRNTRPGLSIDGIIDIRSIGEALYVGKPAYGQSNSEIGLFKIVENPDGTREAIRVVVRLAIGSVNLITIESGLEEGDEIILSDMSRWDSVDRVRLR